MLNNNVTLIGRLTKDLEIKKTPQGVSVTQFDLAVDRIKKENGSDFIRCQTWRQSADYLAQYAKKGYLIALNGRINTRSYDNQQGQKVYVTEVIADQVKILASPQNNQNNGYQQPTQQPLSQPQQTSYSQQSLNNGYDMMGYSQDTINPLDISADELPFY